MKENFARWHLLFSHGLKRDWKIMLVWLFGIGAFSAGFVPAFQELARDGGANGMFEVLQNPAMIAMIGQTPIEYAIDYTVGAMYAHQMLLFSGLLAMIVSGLYVIHRTRREEEFGQRELLCSLPIGREAHSFAVMMQVFILHIALALLITGILLSFQDSSITKEGGFLFGISIGLSGMIGGVLGLLFAQLMQTSSKASGAFLALIGCLYILRAATDVLKDSISRYNPLGWAYRTYPFVENNWYPVLYAMVFIGLFVFLSFILEQKRDLGAGYFPEREGRAVARSSLLSLHGLFLRLNRGQIISWLIAFFILGAAYGSIYGEMQLFIGENDLLKQMFTAQGYTIEESYTAVITMVMMCLVTILPVLIVNRLFVEEKEGRLNQIFAMRISRLKLYGNCLVLAIAVGLLGIFIASSGLGLAAVITMKDVYLQFSDFFKAGFNFLPMILFFIGLATAFLGWAPNYRMTIYIYLIYNFFINYFNNLMEVPKILTKSAIQSWIPQVPIDDYSARSFFAILALSILLMIFGWFGYRKRDFYEEG